jgi:hypothetical protein
MKINIFLQYFKHKDPIRRNEIDYCTKHCLKNKNFDNVYFILESDEDKCEWMKGDNVVIFNMKKRPTFKEILEYSNTITDKDSINILPNSDIFFDDSVLELKNMKDKDFVTLTRWNLDPNTKKAEFFNVNCSQDVWVWKGIVEPGEMNIDWYMGKPGIDNLLCGAFHEAGFRVLNPSLLIKTYHLHQQITRDYSDKDVVLGRLYVLYPTDNMNESKIGFWKDTTNFKA